MAIPENMPRFLRPKEVCAVTGLGLETIRLLELESKFPKRVQLAPRSCGWLESEIRAWADDRVAKRAPEREEAKQLVNAAMKRVPRGFAPAPRNLARKVAA